MGIGNCDVALPATRTVKSEQEDEWRAALSMKHQLARAPTEEPASPPGTAPSHWLNPPRRPAQKKARKLRDAAWKNPGARETPPLQPLLTAPQQAMLHHSSIRRLSHPLCEVSTGLSYDRKAVHFKSIMHLLLGLWLPSRACKSYLGINYFQSQPDRCQSWSCPMMMAI